MPQFQIMPFDVDTASRETWMAFHVYRRAIAAELHPDDPVLSDAEWEHEGRRANPLWECRRWLAVDERQVAGSAGAWFRPARAPNAEDHTRFLRVTGEVLAAARRKGIGTLLLRQVQALMRAMDKSVLTLSAHTAAGHAFLIHVGATAKHSSVAGRARLADLDWPRLLGWEDVPDDLGIVWERYAGRVPREVLTPLLPAISALAADVPHGSLETPPFRREIEGYDRMYESLDRVGGAHHLVLLRDAGGSVVGMSEAYWDSRTPEIAFQQFTAIARPWRGRGLARAVKAALLRQVRSSHPRVEEMRTSNAESNAPILSINRRLGFSVRRRQVDYQMTRAELDSREL